MVAGIAISWSTCNNIISESCTSFAILIALANALSEVDSPSWGTRILLNSINVLG